MLGIYFEAPFTLGRLRSGRFGKYIDGFSQELSNEQYSKETARRYLRSGAHFGRFLEIKRIDLESVDLSALQKFTQHLRKCHCPKSNGGIVADVARGARLFVEYLRKKHGFEIQNFEKTEKDEGELITSFRHWLDQHRGVSQSTQRKYCRGAANLLSNLGDNVTGYTAQNLREFLLNCARKQGPGASKVLITALRMFLRYLASQGKCKAGLERAIPTLAGWRLASLPVYLQASEIQKIMHACDTTTPMGVRDRAIILLLARLGLRAGDVAALRLSNIDWYDGSIVVSGKGGREVRLPLPQEVGNAILKYLKHRPKVKHDVVFVRAVAPYRQFSCGSSLSPIVTRAMRRAGVVSARYGAHILRHTAATEMLRQGVSLYEIGAVLRHRSADMTAYYAKVDVSLLQLVAQPWPEVLS